MNCIEGDVTGAGAQIQPVELNCLLKEDDSTNQNISLLRGKIIYQHEGRPVLPPESADEVSHSNEGPFLAVIAIGSLFLLLTITTLAVSLAFLRQHARNERRLRCSGNARGGGVGGNGETNEVDVFINPRSEWRCSLESDSFEDISDISMEVEVEEEEEGQEAQEEGGAGREVGEPTFAWVYANPRLCPRHSRAAVIQGSRLKTSSIVHDV
ncbi:hypothetical protein EGR_09657 [Echinococcus granulosus]|uniref:Uncharacterized protein n=1 Tax=Echinococcus granulosus TaxID=6210 RepID=W6U327_ECHGR|nr:hypothetical protein EGR_09657 [Echinococcus granulosus]EUB55483.1 hypothetical protein EGR_09657 [Echinococcus granulosus]